MIVAHYSLRRKDGKGERVYLICVLVDASMMIEHCEFTTSIFTILLLRQCAGILLSLMVNSGDSYLSLLRRLKAATILEVLVLT